MLCQQLENQRGTVLRHIHMFGQPTAGASQEEALPEDCAGQVSVEFAGVGKDERRKEGEQEEVRIDLNPAFSIPPAEKVNINTWCPT